MEISKRGRKMMRNVSEWKKDFFLFNVKMNKEKDGRELR